jgi:very-short-patch-repair endonuclease
MVIEIDGAVHQDPSQHERDIERTKILASLGIKVIRFSNEEVIGHLDQVINRIESELSK